MGCSWRLPDPYDNGVKGEVAQYLPEEKWLDHVAYQHNVTIVKSAGNGGYDPDKTVEENGNISPPGKAYNVITVGATDDYGKMLGISSAEYGQACFKPDLSAFGDLKGKAGSGTSYSAAAVTGAIALMYELNPVLKIQPAAVKAILMASCFQKASNATELMGSGGCSLYKWQGAGCLDIRKALAIVQKKQYGTGVLTGDNAYISIQKNLGASSQLNVSLTWLMRSEIFHDTDVTLPYLAARQELNLYLYPSNSLNEIARSAIINSSTEMLSIDRSKFTSDNAYRINISRAVYSTAQVRYGYAWAANTDNYVK